MAAAVDADEVVLIGKLLASVSCLLSPVFCLLYSVFRFPVFRHSLQLDIRHDGQMI